MKKILVLGCTGSIGRQTIDVVRNMNEDFSICGLVAGHNKTELDALCSEFNCQGVLFSRDGRARIKTLVETCGADIAVNGIAGAAGLEPSIFVLENGIDLALANKESVVMAWDLIKAISKRTNAKILPVDSEHSAIFSLLQQCKNENVSSIIITASGGPFRTFTQEQLKNVNLEQALKHPTWAMGNKITIDSASLANKGLEVIEACRLFSMPTENVKVVVHPQSLVHSLVQTKDGMLYAQISEPDMRHPILTALTWPKIAENYLKKFDLFDCEMNFFAPRYEDFPLLSLAYKCAKEMNSYPIAFNAANEVAVSAFLQKKCSFLQISEIVCAVLQNDWSKKAESLESILDSDKMARIKAENYLKTIKNLYPGEIS